MEKYINKEIEVLIEENNNGYWKGHTSNYLVVKVVSKEDLTNQLRKVKVNKIIGLELEGFVTK